jgi:glycosyltransferase involved in cell wall biosynthesis
VSERALATPRAASAPSRDRLAAVRSVAVVPAYNEAESIASVIAEIREADLGFDIVVVDDGSTDRTAQIAAQAGAHVVRLPYNLGIGGAVQTGYQYARDNDFQIAVQIDGDGQHDPKEVPKLLGPLLDDTADMVVGTRFGDSEGYHGPRTRRLGIRIFALMVSLIVRQRVTDTTSGFRAINRRGIILFASDYPHDYPEVEATVLVFKHRLRMIEVPVSMRERAGGRSSITAVRSFYYMVKVSLALFVSLFRRFSTPLEDQ